MRNSISRLFRNTFDDSDVFCFVNFFEDSISYYFENLSGKCFGNLFDCYFGNFLGIGNYGNFFIKFIKAILWEFLRFFFVILSEFVWAFLQNLHENSLGNYFWNSKPKLLQQFLGWFLPSTVFGKSLGSSLENSLTNSFGLSYQIFFGILFANFSKHFFVNIQ